MYSFCASGNYINTVVIEYTKIIAGQRLVYHKITLTNVLVGSVLPVFTYRSNGEFTHLEEVTLRSGKIQWDYKLYDDQGQLIATYSNIWNLKANKAE